VAGCFEHGSADVPYGSTKNNFPAEGIRFEVPTAVKVKVKVKVKVLVLGLLHGIALWICGSLSTYRLSNC
jgi:hypothetical protein